MKTVGDLRKLIKENDGQIKMGLLSFSYNDGEDVDVKIESDLIAWIPSDKEDSLLLTDMEVASISSDHQDPSAKNREVKKENTDLKKEIEVLSGKVNENQIAVGKVEAYEKILLGRDLTIGK